MRDAITDLTAAEETLELNSCPPYVETAATVQQQSGGRQQRPDSLFFPDVNILSHTGNGTGPQGSPSAEGPSPFLPPGCIKCRAHRGMLSSARYVASILDQEHVLEDMLVLQPDYNLIFTGHSLGAGVACLLAIIYRPKYPNLKCYAFSPPGCVISREGVEFTKDFVFSVVFGDDLVSRLSLESMRYVKQNVIDVLHNCDRPKYEIILKGCYKLLCGASLTTDDANAAFSSSFSRPDSPIIGHQPSASSTSDATGVLSLLPTTSVETKTLIQIDDPAEEQPPADFSPLLSPQRRRTMRANYTDEIEGQPGASALASTGCPPTAGGSSRCQLFCPGRIMHLQIRNPASNPAAPSVEGIDNVPPQDQDIQYTARWVDQSRFAHVRMSSSMVSDHMPWTVTRVLKAYLVQEGRLQSGS